MSRKYVADVKTQFSQRKKTSVMFVSKQARTKDPGSKKAGNPEQNEGGGAFYPKLPQGDL